MSKCRLCGKIFTKNEQLGIDYLMTSTNYYYHIKCYERFKQKPLSEEEWRMAIYDFITQDMKFNYNYWPCEKLREKYIKENGYKNVGIYSRKYVFENIIGKDYLQYSDIKIWVAQWNSKCTYNGRYDIWQYTSDGSVDGVPSARVDMNYMYTDFNETGTSTTNTKIDTKPVSLNTNATNGVNVSIKYSVGQKVEVTGYYASSTETNRNKIVKRNTTGTITKIKEGTSNPYLLDNGGLGWCSESDIVRVVEKTEVIYIVKRGDTLSSIAKKYNTTYTKIAKDNGIVNPNIIFIGQKLVIK